MRWENSRVGKRAMTVVLVTTGFATMLAMPASAGQSLGVSPGFQGGMHSHFEVTQPLVTSHPTSGFRTGGIIPPIAPGFLDQGFIPPLVEPGGGERHHVLFPHRHIIVVDPIFVVDPPVNPRQNEDMATAPSTEATIVGPTEPFDAHVVEVPGQHAPRDQDGVAQVIVIRPGFSDKTVTVPLDADAGATSGPQD